MAKYIAYSPNGTAYQCDTLAEARQVEGKRRRNPSSGFEGSTRAMAQRLIDAENRFIEYAKKTAKLNDSEANHVLNIYVAAKAVKLDPVSGNFSVSHGAMLDADVLRNALTLTVADVKGKRRRNPSCCNPGCGCGGACRNPACKCSRNPSRRAVQHTAEGLLDRMMDDGADTYAKKVHWVKKHMPHIDDPQAFVGWVVKAEHNPASDLEEGKRLLSEALRTIHAVGGHGIAESTNLALYRRALELADQAYRHLTAVKGTDPRAEQYIKRARQVSAEAYGEIEKAERPSGRRTVWGTPVRNPPRKKKAQLGLFDAPPAPRAYSVPECAATLAEARWHSPPPPAAKVKACATKLINVRWHPGKRNPAMSHLAHEKLEEQQFAALLAGLPVGKTVTVGRGCRVRKLSKGFVVVNGERMGLADAARVLHRGR